MLFVRDILPLSRTGARSLQTQEWPLDLSRGLLAEPPRRPSKPEAGPPGWLGERDLADRPRALSDLGPVEHFQDVLAPQLMPHGEAPSWPERSDPDLGLPDALLSGAVPEAPSWTAPPAPDQELCQDPTAVSAAELDLPSCFLTET